MRRAVVAFHQNDSGDWVAELSCGHRRPVRHEPPRGSRPRSRAAAGRDATLGAPFDCVACDEDPGGDAACWAHLVCPECGAVLDAGPHRHDLHGDVSPDL